MYSVLTNWAGKSSREKISPAWAAKKWPLGCLSAQGMLSQMSWLTLCCDGGELAGRSAQTYQSTACSMAWEPHISVTHFLQVLRALWFFQSPLCSTKSTPLASGGLKNYQLRLSVGLFLSQKTVGLLSGPSLVSPCEQGSSWLGFGEPWFLFSRRGRKGVDSSYLVLGTWEFIA
jgi:hypothetical protein